MRGAPPVQVVCGPEASWRFFQCTVASVATAVAAGWVGWHQGTGFWVPSGLALASAAWIACRIGRQPAAHTRLRLEWTGQRWLLDGEPMQPQVRLDLGSWMLLRCGPTSRAARWIPIDLASCGPAAHGLRCALAFHAAARAEVTGEGGGDG